MRTQRVILLLNFQVELTSTLLWEIKQARDVNHENTVRFVGACIDIPRPTVLILTEYCPKGSLKDVLENEAIQLDWNFRMSLIHDIVKVQKYSILYLFSGLTDIPFAGDGLPSQQ